MSQEVVLKRFRKDCKNLRKRLRRVSNKKQTYPHDEETRQEYLTVKRQYKSMLQHKRQRYQEYSNTRTRQNK